MTDGSSKSEAKTVSFEQIFHDISSENLHRLNKESLQYCCNALKLKVSGEKNELAQRLEPLGKSKDLFDKKVSRVQETFQFSTALEPHSIPPPSANWKIVGKSEVAVPVVTDSTIKEYQKAKYAGGKGQYRKAYKLFSSRRIMSVKAIDCSNATYVKANILKSYTGSVSRPATVLFYKDTPVKAYCSCAVGKSGLCCHVIALLIQLSYFNDNKKLYLNMTCTEKIQKWHKKGQSNTARVATQVKLKYLRNLRGARRDIKKLRTKRKVTSFSDSDYSDWYTRDILEMEEKVSTKIKSMKPVDNHFFSVLSKHKKKSGLFLHLRYKNEYKNREAGRDYNEHVLKPKFDETTEAVWRPQTVEFKSDITLSDTEQNVINPSTLLTKLNYVPVDQCTDEWRTLRVGVITASKVPSLLGFCGMKEFDSSWFAIRNKLDESVLHPKRSRLPNFIRGKKEESNALHQFCLDSNLPTTSCGYFKHPTDHRFGASPDGVSTGEQQFLVEIKTRSLPNKSELSKLKQDEVEAKILAAQTPLVEITGSHLVQCHLQMECTDTSLVYLMSYVPENKAAAYFPITKNYALSSIMFELLIHMLENKPISDTWAHFEHPSLEKLGNKLEGSIPNFQNTRYFRSWANSEAKLIKCCSFSNAI